jgi:hypothetical protein
MTKIAVKVYEEIKNLSIANIAFASSQSKKYKSITQIEWIDNAGINTPYKVTIIGGEKDGTGR